MTKIKYCEMNNETVKTRYVIIDKTLLSKKSKPLYGSYFLFYIFILVIFKIYCKIRLFFFKKGPLKLTAKNI